MRELSIFTLDQHQGPYESWPWFTKLYASGQWTGSSIRGYLIERQYQLIDGYFLITSDDCPFEETTHFILLDTTFRVLCHKSLWAPYQSYLLMDATPIGERQLRVTFVNGGSWIVTILPRRRLFGSQVQLRRSH